MRTVVPCGNYPTRRVPCCSPVQQIPVGLDNYLQSQDEVLGLAIPRLKPGGSLCWQVGNYVCDNEIFPLDIEFAPIFKKHRLQLTQPDCLAVRSRAAH